MPRAESLDCTMVAAAPVLPAGYVVSARRIADRCYLLFSTAGYALAFAVELHRPLADRKVCRCLDLPHQHCGA